MPMLGWDDSDNSNGESDVDIDDQLRALADEIESADEDDEFTYPRFKGYQMVGDVDVSHGHEFYVDEDGDLWIVEPDGSLVGSAPHHLNQGEVRGLLEEMEKHQ